jgi:predicted aspartyl protease
VSFPFDPSRGPILIEASASGPLGQAELRLLLDTGATSRLIRSTILIALGYDPDQSPDRVEVTMGNGVESVPRLILNRLSALGQHRIGFAVRSHPLPPSSGVDGLIGLDFLRGQLLTLDFRAGLINLV